jgi:hypothetical protein
MHSQNKNRSVAGLNHPSPEDLIASLYGELKHPEKTRLMDHLHDCPECRTKLNGWSDAMQSLDEYRGPVARLARPAASSLFKWGMAAVFALGLGFALGRFALPASADAAALKSSVKAEILAEIREQQDGDHKLIANAIVQSEARCNAKLLSLRHDLETVAVHTQDGLQQAHEQIVTLAGYSPGQTREMNQ